jgi:phosphate transport system permease protein
MAQVVEPTDVTASVRAALRGRRVDLGGAVFQLGLLLTLLVSFAVLVTLLADVWRQAYPVLADRGIGFISSNLSSLPQNAGIWQGLIGSVLLMLVVVAVAFPLGIGAAVFMEEYASDTRLTRFINANIRNLAGVPAVVYGLLGLAIFVRALGSVTGPDVHGRSLLSGGLTLAVMVLPIVIITAAEALRAVPQGIREAAYGVGATRWETIRSHVMPYAAPGILTGTVLSLARALGETAPLILVGAVTGFFATDATFAESFQDQFTSLPTIVFRWATLPDTEFRALTAAAIIVLLAVLLAMNSVALALRNRYERRW